MKKVVIFIALLGTCSHVLAQPTITQSDFSPLNGLTTEFKHYFNGTTPVNTGNAGINQVWNFSAITAADTNYTIWGNPQTNAVFPAANSGFVQHVNGTVIQGYYQLSGNGAYVLGVNMPGAQGAQYVVKETPILRFSLPVSYGDSLVENTDEYQIAKDSNGTNLTRTHYDRSFLLHADAYGTITTPYATHSNALRIKITETENSDSVWTWSGTAWQFSNVTVVPSSGETYYWLVNDTGIVASMGAATFEVNQQPVTVYSGMFYKQHTVMSINDLGENSFTAVYPNPAGSVLNIDVKEAMSINMVNILGSKVITQQLKPGRNSIDVSSLPKGIYFIQLSAGGAARFVKE